MPTKRRVHNKVIFIGFNHKLSFRCWFLVYELVVMLFELLIKGNYVVVVFKKILIGNVKSSDGCKDKNLDSSISSC